LRFSRENFVAAVQAGEVEDDGVEAAFEVITDISERYGFLVNITLRSSH
jgi:coatomer subunit beta'